MRGVQNRHRGDDSGRRIHPTDAAVGTIRDEDIAGPIHRQTTGKRQRAGDGQPAISGEGKHPGAGHRTDDPGGGIHPANPVIVGIRNE